MIPSDFSSYWDYELAYAPHEREIIFIPNSNTHPVYLLYCLRRFSPEYSLIHSRNRGKIFKEFIPQPFQSYPRDLSFHPFTPYAGVTSSILVLPVIFRLEIVSLSTHRLYTLFELPSLVRSTALQKRINYDTKIRLRDAADPPVEPIPEYPDYCVVGSLGLWNDMQDREILLLCALGVAIDDPYRYVRLIVHPTHVSSEVGFVLSLEADWRLAVLDKLEIWRWEEPNEPFEDKLKRMELAYAYGIVSIRDHYNF